MTSVSSLSDFQLRSLLYFSLAGGVALRFFHLDQPQLWLDEIIQLIRFSSPGIWQNLLDLRHEIAAAPLDYMVQTVVVRTFGVSEFWARLHAAVFGCLALPALYFLARLLLSRRGAVLAVLLLAFFPLHGFYSQEGRNYSLFFFLTLCSYGLLLFAIRQGRWLHWVLLGLVNLALLYTNYFGILVLACQSVWFLSLQVRFIPVDPDFASGRGGRRLFRCLTCWLVPLALFLPWVFWTWDSVRPRAANPLLEPGLCLRLFKEISGGSYPLSLLFTLLGIAGLIQLSRDRKWTRLLLLVTWFLLPVPAVLILDWWGGYFLAIRQLLFSTPGWILLAAAGLDSLPSPARVHRGTSLQLISGSLAVLLGLGTVLLSDRKDEVDWKGLAGYLRSETLPTDAICAPGLERIIAFRFPEIHQRSLSMDGLSEVLRERPAVRVYLVESLYQSRVDREAIEAARTWKPPLSTRELPGFRIDLLVSDAIR